MPRPLFCRPCAWLVFPIVFHFYYTCYILFVYYYSVPVKFGQYRLPETHQIPIPTTVEKYWREIQKSIIITKMFWTEFSEVLVLLLVPHVMEQHPLQLWRPWRPRPQGKCHYPHQETFVASTTTAHSHNNSSLQTSKLLNILLTLSICFVLRLLLLLKLLALLILRLFLLLLLLLLLLTSNWVCFNYTVLL